MNNKTQESELCIICCQQKTDQWLDLGCCDHREFCTKCCIRYFEQEKYNRCPRCTAKVGNFIICSTKIIKVQSKKRKISKVY